MWHDVLILGQHQVMACRLFIIKLLPEPMKTYCQLDPQEQISVKSELKCKTYHSRKCIWKCRLWNVSHFVQVSMCQMVVCSAHWYLAIICFPGMTKPEHYGPNELNGAGDNKSDTSSENGASKSESDPKEESQTTETKGTKEESKSATDSKEENGMDAILKKGGEDVSEEVKQVVEKVIMEKLSVELKGVVSREGQLGDLIQCGACITRSILSQIFTKYAPYLARKVKVWGVFCGSSMWLIFCLSSCNYLCNILQYWTAL